MRKGVPISPDDECLVPEPIIIPPEVFDAVNELIYKEINDPVSRASDRIKLYQKDIVRLAKEKLSGGEAPVNFDCRWLDFEPHYRELGWGVEYDKPAYNESYDAYFMFTRPPPLRRNDDDDRNSRNNRSRN